MQKQAVKSRKTQTASNKSAAHKNNGTGMAHKNDGSGGALLDKFFLDAIKDMYWAEKHLTKALPKLKKAATSEELKSAFENHLTATEEHVSRLEQVFDLLGKKAASKKCEAMEGLSKEADSIIEETEAGTFTRDVALIIAAQKVEHYEIATYGGLVQLAKTMGQEEIARILHETLDEEKEADETLTSIAENDLNYQAEEEDGSTED
jgi:ferritin-like metal-binding protein YciE